MESMALKNLLIKGDNGIEKYVIAAYISSKFKSVVWISSSLCPSNLKPYLDAFNLEPTMISGRRCRGPETLVINPLNLNEINVASVKLLDISEKPVSIVLDNISELIMIHGVDKVYLYLSDLIEVASMRGGYVIGVAGEDINRYPTLSTLFPNIILIKREIDGDRWKRSIIVEKWDRGLQKEIYSFDLIDYNLEFPNALLEDMMKGVD